MFKKRDLKYEKNNIAYNFHYPKEKGGGIKCINYDSCQTVLPKWWYQYKGNYSCINCGLVEWCENLYNKNIDNI